MAADVARTIGMAAAETTGMAAAETTGMAAAETTGMAAAETTGAAAAETTGAAAAETTGAAAAETTGAAAAETTGAAAAATGEVGDFDRGARCANSPPTSWRISTTKISVASGATCLTEARSILGARPAPDRVTNACCPAPSSALSSWPLYPTHQPTSASRAGSVLAPG